MDEVNEVLAAMKRTNAVFCEKVIGAGDMSALGRVYTAEAMVLPPGTPLIRGLEQIAHFWQGAIAGLGITGAELSTLTVEVYGDTAVEVGEAALHLKTGEPARAKYMVHWKGQGADGWRWDKDIWNL